MPQRITDNREHIRAIFFEAYKKKTTKERSRCLNEAYGTDTRLRAELDSLFKAHKDSNDFLEVSPPDASIAWDASPLSKRPGTIIGRYKLLERIGEICRER